MALKRAVAARRTARTYMVESQVRVSRSNPLIERAVRKWREQFRKLKLHLEDRINERIPPTHPMVPWLVNWAGEVLMKFHIKDNGRTAYEEITGHRARHKVCGFGEDVQFQLARDEHHRISSTESG